MKANNYVAKHFNTFNKNKVEVDRKKEVKKTGNTIDTKEENWDDYYTEDEDKAGEYND